MDVCTRSKHTSHIRYEVVMKFKRLHESINAVDNVKLLFESRQGPLASALSDLIPQMNVPYVLGGGLAIGYHTRPRGTEDIDIFLRSEEDLFSLVNNIGARFRRHRKHAIEHRPTGVEIELLTPEFLGINRRVIDTAIDTAIKDEDGINVVSRSGLIALKLQRSDRRDLADIESLVASGDIEIDEFGLSDEQLEKLRDIIDNPTIRGVPEEDEL